jgi:hypothetical protein
MENDSVNLNLLREDGKNELLEILETIRGKKCLVLDAQLGGLLNLIVLEGSKLLKENGVHHFRDLKGDLGDFTSESGARDVPDNIIYLCRANISLMKVIAKQVQACISRGMRTQYHIYFVPHRTVACEQALEDEGISGNVEINEFHLGFIPFDTDLLSLEMDSVFRQVTLDAS